MALFSTMYALECRVSLHDMIGLIPYPVVLLTCCLHAFMYTVRPFYTFNAVLRLSLPIHGIYQAVPASLLACLVAS